MIRIGVVTVLCGAFAAASSGTPQDTALQRAKATACANNLKQLWQLQIVYMSQFGGRLKNMPPDTGRAFWLALAKTQPPLIDETECEVYVCPFSIEKPRKGFTTYRGPAVKVSTLKGEDPVGVCLGLHPDKKIIVLYKSGDIKELGPTDPDYERAVKGTLFASPPDPKEQEAACRKMIQQLSTALKLFELDFAVYPPSGNAAMVAKLREKGAKKAAYVEFAKESLNEKGEVLDPWGRPYVYINTTDRSAPPEWKARHKDSFDLYSIGPNGKDEQGQGDDLFRD